MASPKIQVICPGCKKEIEASLFTGPGPQTAIVQCECGARVELHTSDGSGKGDTREILKEIQNLMSQVPAILQEFRRSKMEGTDTGICQAVSLVSRELAREILGSDSELRDALKEIVLEELRHNLLGEEEEGEAKS